MITVLPGMGANNRMYSGAWRELRGYDYLDWPAGIAPDSIAGLAKSIAEGMDYQPTALIGSSLGGMVALELASLMKVQDVALLGSALSSNEINPLLRLLGPIAEVSPLSLCQVLAGKSPSLLSRMYSEQDPEFIRSMIRSALHWSYKGGAKVYRVHGRHDLVIQCLKADVWLEAGHLIAMTNPEECITSIQRWRIEQGIEPDSLMGNR
ncbi:MAG: hypothetical protein M5U26_08775 [Planctomycetota bacterium]|nr:hypothetical protein [Planctomycetota bacterium]